MAGRTRIGERQRRASARIVLGAVALLLTTGLVAHAADDAAGRIERIDLKGDGPSTKVIVMLSRPLAFNVHVLGADAAKKLGRRLVLDFANATVAPEATKPIVVGNAVLGQIRTGQFNAQTARIVLELVGDTTHSVEPFESPPHVTISFGGAATVGAPAIEGAPSTDGARAPSAGTLDAPQPAADPGPAAETPPSTATSESNAPKPSARTIPLKARGRRPYSLIY